MPKQAKNLSELVGEEKGFALTVAEMKEMVEQFKAKFGGYSRKFVNMFYDKAGIAQIAWEQKMKDGTFQALPLGRLISVYEYPEQNGTKAWKEHKYDSDFPYLFWEECYRQIGAYIAKKEYAQKMELLDLENIAKTI